MGNLQDIFNLLPNLSTPKPVNGDKAASIENSELARAMSLKTNDQLMAIYLSSLIRAITAFHDLIDNKIQNKQAQEEKDGKKEEEKDGKKANGTSDEDTKEGKEGETEGKEKARDESKKK